MNSESKEYIKRCFKKIKIGKNVDDSVLNYLSHVLDKLIQENLAKCSNLCAISGKSEIDANIINYFDEKLNKTDNGLFLEIADEINKRPIESLPRGVGPFLPDFNTANWNYDLVKINK
ncbi:hypothetical protein MHBO_001786 [Bonamia ostreae]|uniref:Uncharacterized protein n=1 Tax=Bonamia ostreae TaxID=126728 RepID=A0ABV2AKZ3_9EUKA